MQAPAVGVRLQLLHEPCVLLAEGASDPAQDAGPEAVPPGARVRSLPLGPSDAALLALLALDGSQTRARVIELLWPDEPDAARARNALRQRLFRLRRSAGCELVGGEERLALLPGLAHDLGDPRERLADDPAHAVQGELLGEERYDGLIEFSAWLEQARER